MSRVRTLLVAVAVALAATACGATNQHVKFLTPGNLGDTTVTTSTGSPPSTAAATATDP